MSRDDQEAVGRKLKRPFAFLTSAHGYSRRGNVVVIGEGVGCSSCAKLPCPVIVGRHVSVRSFCDECFKDCNSLGQEWLTEGLHAPDSVMVDYQPELVEWFRKN